MRGSGELGASIASCWATRLQDKDEPYKSPSYIENVKQRDFESRPFEAVSNGESGIMRRITPEDESAKLQKKTEGNKDGRDEDAKAYIVRRCQAEPEVSNRVLAGELSEMEISRGHAWVGTFRRVKNIQSTKGLKHSEK